MGVIKAGEGIALDMREFDVEDLGEIVEANQALVRVRDDEDNELRFGGSFDIQNQEVKGGTITSIDSFEGNVLVFSALDLSIDAGKFLALVEAEDTVKAVGLVLAGNDSISGSSKSDFLFGGSGNDSMSGGGGKDTLIGLDGADTLDGGGSNDFLHGGKGNDVYIVGSTKDVATEAAIQGANGGIPAGSGSDTVRSSVDYKLGVGIEFLVLTGSADRDATGNSANNGLTGNIGDNILDGGAGRDTLTGGEGDDLYIIDLKFDRVVEAVDGGDDTVSSSVSYRLADNVEDLVLTGSKGLSGYGNALANDVTGTSGKDKLYGEDANDKLFGNGNSDILDGGAGRDTLAGGAGSDTYYVDSSKDRIVEASDAGTDRVYATASFTLRANVENLYLRGSAVTGNGNGDTNDIYGNAVANKLNGLGGEDYLLGDKGNDTLAGGAGKDRVKGGEGDDRFVFTGLADLSGKTAASADRILDFEKGDRIDLSKIDGKDGVAGSKFSFIDEAAFSGAAGELRAAYSGSRTMIYGDTDGDGQANFAIRLDGSYTAGSLAAVDFIL